MIHTLFLRGFKGSAIYELNKTFCVNIRCLTSVPNPITRICIIQLFYYENREKYLDGRLNHVRGGGRKGGERERETETESVRESERERKRERERGREGEGDRQTDRQR